MRTKLVLLVVAPTAAALTIGIGAAAMTAGDQATASCTADPSVQDTATGSQITVVCTVPKPPPVTVTVTATPDPSSSPTPTATSTPKPTSEPAPTQSATATTPATPTQPPPANGCVKPDATNTGATGALATYTGPTVLTTPGQTLQNVRVNGTLEVRADNVTISNVAATGGVFVNRAKNATVSHLTGPGVATSSGTGLTVVYSDLGGVDDGDSLTITSDAGTYITSATVRGNWIHDPQPAGADHYDGIQVRGASNVVVDCNNFDLGAYRTQYNAAIYFEYANGGYSGVSVTNNWLSGGAFSTMWGTANDNSTVLSGNHFGGDIHWNPCYHQESNSKPPTQTGNTLNGSAFTPCA
jgi:hypothetical protein